MKNESLRCDELSLIALLLLVLSRVLVSGLDLDVGFCTGCIEVRYRVYKGCTRFTRVIKGS